MRLDLTGLSGLHLQTEYHQVDLAFACHSEVLPLGFGLEVKGEPPLRNQVGFESRSLHHHCPTFSSSRASHIRGGAGKSVRGSGVA